MEMLRAPMDSYTFFEKFLYKNIYTHLWGLYGTPSLAIGPIWQPIGFHRVPYKLTSKKVSFPQAPRARENGSGSHPKAQVWPV